MCSCMHARVCRSLTQTHQDTERERERERQTDRQTETETEKERCTTISMGATERHTDRDRQKSGFTALQWCSISLARLVRETYR